MDLLTPRNPSTILGRLGCRGLAAGVMFYDAQMRLFVSGAPPTYRRIVE